MKLTLQHVHVKSTHELDSVIEERILDLSSEVQIDEAVVRLEHQRDASPAFRVHIHIVTPGPDLLVEGCDHTIRAALDKAVAELEARIHGRGLKRAQRVKSNLQRQGSLRHGPGLRMS